MRLKTTALLLSALAVSAAGCTNIPRDQKAKHIGQHWQRIEPDSALYLRGVKAQQALNRDIALCVNDVRNIVREASIREAIPADNDPAGNPPDPATPEGHLAQWNSPERDGYLLAEHSDYHDFEGCMHEKGWERPEELPASRELDARKKYLGWYVDDGENNPAAREGRRMEDNAPVMVKGKYNP